LGTDMQSGQVFDLEELKSLRSELLLRMAIQNGILLFLIPMLLATVMVQAAHPASALVVALGYCVAAGMGALIWCHCGVRQAQIKAYLLVLETRLAPRGGWESWLPAHRIGGWLGTRWFVSTKGVFMGSQLAAVASALWIGSERDWPLLATAAAVMAATAWFLLVNPKESLDKLEETPGRRMRSAGSVAMDAHD
jgi:hypothetical protein